MDTRAPGDIDMTTNMPDDLLTGYHRFRANRYAREVERYHMLAEGQSPKTMIIGCADSRVDPSTIFSAGPGSYLSCGMWQPLCRPMAKPPATTARLQRLSLQSLCLAFQTWS